MMGSVEDEGLLMLYFLKSGLDRTEPQNFRYCLHKNVR